MSGHPVKPNEWIEFGHVAVHTSSILTAARVAAKVTRTRQLGSRTVDGKKIEFMCLARFREQLASQ